MALFISYYANDQKQNDHLLEMQSHLARICSTHLKSDNPMTKYRGSVNASHNFSLNPCFIGIFASKKIAFTGGIRVDYPMPM